MRDPSPRTDRSAIDAIDVKCKSSVVGSSCFVEGLLICFNTIFVVETRERPATVVYHQVAVLTSFNEINKSVKMLLMIVVV